MSLESFLFLANSTTDFDLVLNVGEATYVNLQNLHSKSRLLRFMLGLTTNTVQVDVMNPTNDYVPKSSY